MSQTNNADNVDIHSNQANPSTSSLRRFVCLFLSVAGRRPLNISVHGSAGQLVGMV